MIQQEFFRSFLIEIPEKESIQTPFFFPAISTIKTNFSPSDYLDLILQIGYPGFLISSYDIYKAKKKNRKNLVDLISKCRNNSTIILLDNGNYEAFWYRDNNWKLNNLESILNEMSVDMCFSFDVFWKNSKNFNQYIDKIVSSISKSAAIQKAGLTIPIIHSDPKVFPTVINKIIDIVNPEFIAVPERELGSSLIERAKTIRNIRNTLNKTGRPVALHLLGTGNPISILVYTLSGADSYDGLEWCQTVVDPETGLLYHFSQRDLFNCDCYGCRLKRFPYHIKTLIHNLLYYLDFLKEIKDSLQDDNAIQLLNKYLPKRNVNKIKKIIGSK